MVVTNVKVTKRKKKKKKKKKGKEINIMIIIHLSHIWRRKSVPFGQPIDNGMHEKIDKPLRL